MNVLITKPIGWWYNYGDEPLWHGPFKTEEEAVRVAHALVPLEYSSYTLLQVAPWEEKTVENK